MKITLIKPSMGELASGYQIAKGSRVEGFFMGTQNLKIPVGQSILYRYDQ